MHADTLEREISRLEEARLQGCALVAQGKLEEAEAFFASLLPAGEESTGADGPTGTFEFHNGLEERCFFESHPDMEAFTRVQAPLLPVLYSLCDVRVARGKLDEALETVEAAIRRNPMSAMAMLQKVDILRRQGHLDDAFALASQAHALCYTLEHFARCYCCLALCLADAERWEAAHATAVVSLQCGKTPQAAEVLREARNHLDGECAVDEDGSNVLRVLDEAGLPHAPDPRWWRIAAQLAHEHLERDDPAGAIEFLKVACGLEPDPDMARLVENLERSVQGGNGRNPVKSGPARGFELVFDGAPPDVRPEDHLSIANEIRAGDTVFLLRTGETTIELRCLRESPHPGPETPLYTAVRTEDGGVAFMASAPDDCTSCNDPLQ